MALLRPPKRCRVRGVSCVPLRLLPARAAVPSKPVASVNSVPRLARRCIDASVVSSPSITSSVIEPMLKFHPLKVKARNEIAEDAVCITFELPRELRDEFHFEAGQHIAVRLPEGDVRRTYSIVCPTGSADLSIGVRLQPGGEVSNYLAQRLKIGETLEVLTLNGSFHPRIEPQRVKRYIAFAAGSGITPVLSIAATTLALEHQSRFILFYGNRTTASTMFVDEVLAL